MVFLLFLNSDFCEFGLGMPFVINFPPQGQLLLSCMSLIMCTEELARVCFLLGGTSCHCLHAGAAQLSGLDSPRMACIPFAASVLLIVASSQKCPSLSFLWLSLQVVLDHGKTTCFTIFGDA